LRIAVDAMGGDFAPQEIVAGVVEAVRRHRVPVTLVGRAEAIRSCLGPVRDLPGLQIVDAPDVIGMDESPMEAFKSKKHSSLRVAADLVRAGEAQGLVSAGNSGAVMAVGKMVVGTLKGVERPGLAASIPSVEGLAVVVDAGANVDCKAKHLEQFAVMGSCYAQLMLKKEKPRVGVLSIGEEEGKGNALSKEAFELLQKADLNFIGNVEGRDLFLGKVDVVVTDGFAGNVLLKTAEGAGEMMFHILKREFSGSLKAGMGFFLSKGVFRALYKKVDYAEYGGAPLLGLKGGCFICHGRSKAKATMNAVRIAHQFLVERIPERIQHHMREGSLLEKFSFDWRS
jgi:glycerol-3-phosphate acyltransferase PlsX